MSFAGAPAPVLASRRAKDLFVPRSASLPPRCVKCGAAAATPWRKKFYWHNQALFLLVLLNVIIYVIVAMIVRKQMELNVPLCDEHHANRKRYKLIATLMLILCIPVGVVLGMYLSEAMGWITGSLMFVVSIVFYAMTGLGFAPKKIDEAGGVFRGACAAFLDQLPEHQ
jgi:FtsH-binding integral membrane protein